MEKILVSACLLGEPVRHNGAHKRSDDQILQRWIREGRVVAVCPEIAGGLPVPRPAAEIASGVDGTRVLSGEAIVVDDNGRDVSHHFVIGANVALQAARAHNIRIAILKEGSPSCGSGYTYDGTFTSTRVPGNLGVTAALLKQHGIQVFSELQLAEAEECLENLAAIAPS
ncbi:MAG: hypothetical protein QOK37_162 [Thermoanaerobaculia bacterium]|jgi:uncharacterized protein YbbK (DUF523 family)|nr:hypothetical protein [Thermoanaerobaculia bacterium]